MGRVRQYSKPHKKLQRRKSSSHKSKLSKSQADIEMGSDFEDVDSDKEEKPVTKGKLK